MILNEDDTSKDMGYGRRMEGTRERMHGNGRLRRKVAVTVLLLAGVIFASQLIDIPYITPLVRYGIMHSADLASDGLRLASTWAGSAEPPVLPEFSWPSTDDGSVGSVGERAHPKTDVAGPAQVSPPSDSPIDVVMTALMEGPGLFPIRYCVDDSALPHRASIHGAFMAWKEINPGFEFHEASRADCVVEIHAMAVMDRLAALEIGEHDGYYSEEYYMTPSGSKVVTGAEIHYVMGGRDCNDRYVRYTDLYVKDIIAHEIGHHLGIGHTLDEDDLMYGDDGVRPHSFDGMGYEIPLNSAGPEDLYVGLRNISDELERTSAELDQLNAEYSRYPEIARDDLEYMMAEQLYDDISGLVDEYNVLVERLNCFSG